ncbi:hypothetical protein GUI51_06475 [Enterococcus mundtii]|uniref:Uncharacterized protein n=1 Tax=Enterococcus mundtii TaxID=53346 RepID=A0ABQ0VBZ6_ENTMU|nr:hypothetical protein [Enterococcus mundtii]GEN17579.1 hypothetical protein LAC02_08600 [Ligilactobacillus acidipiscis]AUB51834.1 hypothetical protein EM4838_02075 [Enterococcus mundtii]MZZ58764.1 hypothetical protein [Enterococcus mundtii]MZZ61598.1 hypothetical protein [Enterococcus mundtii]MZZ68724.1 hypothetical protein [Enterococcus mundtii]
MKFHKIGLGLSMLLSILLMMGSFLYREEPLSSFAFILYMVIPGLMGIYLTNCLTMSNYQKGYLLVVNYGFATAMSLMRVIEFISSKL